MWSESILLGYQLHILTYFQIKFQTWNFQAVSFVTSNLIFLVFIISTNSSSLHCCFSTPSNKNTYATLLPSCFAIMTTCHSSQTRKELPVKCLLKKIFSWQAPSWSQWRDQHDSETSCQYWSSHAVAWSSYTASSSCLSEIYWIQTSAVIMMFLPLLMQFVFPPINLQIFMSNWLSNTFWMFTTALWNLQMKNSKCT